MMNNTTMRVMMNPAGEFPGIPALPAMAGYTLINWRPMLLLMLLLALWFIPPARLHQIDPTAATVDQGIWLLVILSLITFLILAALCWWLLNLYWRLSGLPSISGMVSQFKLLTLCQQFGFYLLSFALLLLAALGCLVAIC